MPANERKKNQQHQHGHDISPCKLKRNNKTAAIFLNKFARYLPEKKNGCEMIKLRLYIITGAKKKKCRKKTGTLI